MHTVDRWATPSIPCGCQVRFGDFQVRVHRIGAHLDEQSRGERYLPRRETFRELGYKFRRYEIMSSWSIFSRCFIFYTYIHDMTWHDISESNIFRIFMDRCFEPGWHQTNFFRCAKTREWKRRWPDLIEECSRSRRNQGRWLAPVIILDSDRWFAFSWNLSFWCRIVNSTFCTKYVCI